MNAVTTQASGAVTGVTATMTQSHPAIQAWIQNMRNNGFSAQQIQLHLQQQQQAQRQLPPIQAAPTVHFYQQPMAALQIPTGAMPHSSPNVQWMQRPVQTTMIPAAPSPSSTERDGRYGEMPSLEEDPSTKLQREINELKRKNASLEKRLAMMQSADKLVLETMTLEELDQAKANCRERIRLIEDAEKHYIDSNYKCVACLDRKRNVVFLDGCDHQSFCDRCESASKTKVCPICQTPYSNVRTLH